MVCLDTDFIIYLLKNNPKAVKKLENMKNIGAKLSTTAINVLELYKGAFAVKKPDKVQEVDDILKTLEVLPLTDKDAKLFGSLFNDPIIKSKFPGDPDLMIASIVISAGESFLTNNNRHFSSVPGLTLETW